MKKKLIIVQFSGGKDSLASLLWAIEKYGKENINVIFCDTGWEHPLTYEYIKTTMKQLDMEIIVVSSEKYDGFLDMVKKKGRFPSSQARFCTEELKSKPMIDYILDVHKYHFITVQGIRKDESSSRSKMNMECRYFKYYFEPYRTNSIIVSELKSEEKLTINQIDKLKKAEDRLKEGHEDPKFHTYRKKEIMSFCENYSDDVMRPIFHLTAIETIGKILDAGMKPNPLYYIIGAGRVGCFPCIMVTHDELWGIIENEYWVIDKIADFEKANGSSFFAPDYIPKRYCSKSAINKKGKEVRYPIIEDVVRYLQDKHAQIDMGLFKEPNDGNRSCMSFYSICE